MIRVTLIELRAASRWSSLLLAVALLFLVVALTGTWSYRLFQQTQQATDSQSLGGRQFNSQQFAGQGFPGQQGTPYTPPTPSNSLANSAKGEATLALMGAAVVAVTGLLAAVFALRSVCWELANDHLDDLAATIIGIRGTVLAKALAAWLLAVIVGASSLPYLSIVAIYDVPDWHAIAELSAILAVTVFLGAAVGVLAAAIARVQAAAALLAFSLFVAILAGAFLIGIGAVGSGALSAITQWLLVFSPFSDLYAVGKSAVQADITLPVLLDVSPTHPISLIGNVQVPVPFWILNTVAEFALASALIRVAMRLLVQGGSLKNQRT